MTKNLVKYFAKNLFVFLLGIVSVICGNIFGNEYLTSFGIILAIILGVKLVRLLFIISNKNLREDFDKILDNNINKFNRAGRVAYVTMEFVLFAAYMYGIACYNFGLVCFSSLVMCAGIVAYLIANIAEKIK